MVITKGPAPVSSRDRRGDMHHRRCPELCLERHRHHALPLPEAAPEISATRFIKLKSVANIILLMSRKERQSILQVIIVQCTQRT